MSDEEITVGAVSAGGEGAVDLPVVELLTGRGFVTGKSGSGKSNTASVVAEKLLDRGLGLLIVDIDGEYYGLKEEYEILHVGADEECDIRVSPEHAGKIAELALEKHVPIILDVSSFLDESEAKELLKQVARQLFAKEKKLKQPFLLVVEEIHEYLPEGGGLDECGRMLIKVAKRGRKHGLGVCGISQRPADVKKDFITQCDWLVWHRLTWGNDTKVVKRILGSDYADRVEELNDGEGFLMTDWDEDVRQVQFQRKRTFDAGATPGLDDFERPELKSVSGDLVSDLEEITEEKRARQSRIQELERELKDREERIDELEEELEEARDLSNMAEQFARAMMAHATGRPFRTDITGYQADLEEASWSAADAAGGNGDGAMARDDTDGPVAEAWDAVDVDPAALSAGASATDGTDSPDDDGDVPPDEEARPRPTEDVAIEGPDEGFTPAYEPFPDTDDPIESDGDDGAVESLAEGTPEATGTGGTDEEATDTSGPAETPDDAGADGIIVPGDDGEPVASGGDDTASADGDTGDGGTTATEGGTSDFIVAGDGGGVASPSDAEREDETPDEEPGDDDDGGEFIVAGEDPVGGNDATGRDTADRDGSDGDGTADSDEVVDGSAPAESRSEPGDGDSGTVEGVDPGPPEPPVETPERGTADPDPSAEWAEEPAYERPIVSDLRERIESMDPVTRGMLAYYRDRGPASPVDAQVAAGGDGERTRAYGRNRELREAGLVAHAGRGQYGYAVPSRVDEAHDGRLDEDAVAAAVRRIEEAFLDRPDAPWPTA